MNDQLYQREDAAIVARPYNRHARWPGSLRRSAHVGRSLRAAQRALDQGDTRLWDRNQAREPQILDLKIVLDHVCDSCNLACPRATRGQHDPPKPAETASAESASNPLESS